MNILILGGSPKGEASVTLQTALYLEKRFPAQTFRYLHAGATIRALERDFSPAAEALDWAELLLFVYPVYTFLVPCQLHRFVELCKEKGLPLAGKWASQLSTSKHFYDVTAHRFLEENCLDLGLKTVRGLSADMEDLLCEKGRAQAEAWFSHLLWSVEQDLHLPFPTPAPAPARRPVTPLPIPAGEKPGRVVIVADLAGDEGQLRAMIERFRAVFPRSTELIDLAEAPLKGGCLSCFRCAKEGKCVYTDGFDRFLRERIQSAEAIVLAYTIRDHSMGSRFKMYDDRQFCNGHRSVTMGKPFAYLVSGDLAREENLRMLMEARAETGGNWLAGVATDQRDPDGEIDAAAAELAYALDRGYAQPANFYGVGGMKIFRDLIWEMQGLMRADHKFYKAHGQYDFPQKRRARMLLMYLAGAAANNEKLMKKAGNAMTEGMLMPYRKVLAAAKPRTDERS